MEDTCSDPPVERVALKVLELQGAVSGTPTSDNSFELFFLLK